MHLFYLLLIPTGIVFRIIPEAAFASSGRTDATVAIIDVSIAGSPRSSLTELS